MTISVQLRKLSMILNKLMRTKYPIIFKTKIILNFGERGITNTKLPLMQQLVWEAVVILWPLQPPSEITTAVFM